MPISRFLQLLLGAALSISIAGCAADEQSPADSAVNEQSTVDRAVGEQSTLFPISVAGKWGYIDVEGNVVIESRFGSAQEFSEGVAAVSNDGTTEEDRAFDGKYEGFIDRTGKFVIPPKPPAGVEQIKPYWTYSYSYSEFHEGLARIHISDSSGADGYIDRSGKLVVPTKFDTYADFSEGLAYARTWRHWSDDRPPQVGYIDRRGQFVIRNDDFRFGHEFSDGRAVVMVHSEENAFGDCALIDREGKFVVPPGKYTSLADPVNGAIRAVKNEEVGLIDIHGKVIVPFGKYDGILQPADGDVFTAEANGKTVLIDATGKQLSEVAEQGRVGRFEGGMAPIEQGGRYGYIDTTGALRIAPQFDAARAAPRFNRGLALVRIGESGGYINLQGKFVWKTDQWDEPLRNSLRKPLSTFLPETTVKALPLSNNWGGVKNAIVFVADGDLDAVEEWYKKRCSNKLEVEDYDLDIEDEQLDLAIYAPDAGFIEVFAASGTGDKESVDGFVSFYACDNMDELRKAYPTKLIGILIEN